MEYFWQTIRITCPGTYDKTWTLRISDINWKHFCLKIRQPRRIATVCYCAPQKYSYLLTYLLITRAELWPVSNQRQTKQKRNTDVSRWLLKPQDHRAGSQKLPCEEWSTSRVRCPEFQRERMLSEECDCSAGAVSSWTASPGSTTSPTLSLRYSDAGGWLSGLVPGQANIYRRCKVVLETVGKPYWSKCICSGISFITLIYRNQPIDQSLNQQKCVQCLLRRLFDDLKISEAENLLVSFSIWL